MTTTTEKKSRISRLKVGIAALAISALLVVPASADDHHTDTDTVTFEVEAGLLTVALSGGTLADAPYSNDASTTTGSITVGVDEERGGDGNWDVSLEADDFENASQDGDVIPASGLSITGVQNLSDSSDGDATGNVTAEDNVSDFSTATQIGSGADAHGNFTWDADLELAIPAGTSADSYESTLTLTSSEAP